MSARGAVTDAVNETPLHSEMIEIPDSAGEATRLFFERGWSDGLPVLPPTEAAVREMFRYTDREPDDVVAILPPRYGEATVEKIAINAVMAGCLPEYLPVLVAAVQAMSDERLNLSQILTSTHGCSPLVMVGGPLIKELRLNFGYHTSGEGLRSIATIGRAISLIAWNIAGLPGRTNVDTFGAITRYHHVFAENEDQSPWEPLHVERGLERHASAVSVFGAEPAHHIDDMGSTTAQGMLTTLVNTLPGAGTRHFQEFGEPLIVLGPQHARIVAKGGYSKADVKRFIYEHARLPVSKHSQENFEKVCQVTAPKWYCNLAPEALIPIAESRDDIVVVVSGGPGSHSLFIPQQVYVRSVTKAVTRKDGTPIRSVKDFLQ